MFEKPVQFVRQRLGSGEPTGNDIPVTVYTREDCHLCDDALAVLQRHGIAAETVDIDANPTLLEKYNTCVPVVVIDGKVRFRGRIDERLLRRLLRARST